MKKFFGWLKRQIWLPMSGLIFGTYMIQRGMASLANAGISDHLKDAVSIMFTTAAVAALAAGMLLDNVRAKTMILIAGIGAAFGIALLPYTPWAFGLLFGAAAAIFKIVPYSKPLKEKLDGIDSLRIAPQASAKNFGAALFIGLIGSVAGVMGLVPISIVMSALMLAMALIAYAWIGEDVVIYKWRLKSVYSLFKNWKFWLFMVYSFVMVGMYYVGVSSIYPALVGAGLAKGTALSILAGSFVVAGLLRWPWAWVGHISRYWIPMLGGILGLMAATYGLAVMKDPLATAAFILFGSAHTPNYWAFAKTRFGTGVLATVMGMAMVAMYLGAGVIYGKW